MATSEESSEEFLRVLYLHPFPRREILRGWRIGTHPDTLLMGLNHMQKHRINPTLLDPDQNFLHNFLSQFEKISGLRMSQQLRAFSLKNYDAIVCRDMSTVLLLTLLKRTRVESRPIVLTGLVIHRSLPLKRIIGETLNGLDAVIYQARCYREILVEMGVCESKLVFSPWSIDHRFYSPLNVKEGDYILSVGNTDRDYISLVKATKGLRLNLVIVTEVKSYLRLAREGIKVCRMTPLQLREAYARCRFTVVPVVDSEVVPGSTAVLEAMAMGKAVIVSKIKGLSEFVKDGENGLMFPPHDHNKLREAILYLYEDPREAEKLGIKGRAVVEQHFNTEKQGALISHIIKKIIEGN